MAGSNRPIAVIEAKLWRHTSGRSASIYGALPWSNPADKDNWKLQKVGYTWTRADGTISPGSRQPFKTKREAEAALKKEHKRLDTPLVGSGGLKQKRGL